MTHDNLKTPTDNQVGAALEAGQAEAKTWRIIDFKEGWVVAVNDLRPSPEVTGPEPIPTAVSYERLDFATSADAREYIEWRSIKAALTAYERVRK